MKAGLEDRRTTGPVVRVYVAGIVTAGTAGGIPARRKINHRIMNKEYRMTKGRWKKDRVGKRLNSRIYPGRRCDAFKQKAR